MKHVFDLIETINDKVMQYFDETGRTPTTITISPNSYRRLLEIKTDEAKTGNLIIGYAPITEIQTPLGRIRLQLDEMLSDTDVEVA